MTQKKRTKKDRLLDVVKQMPPLYHKLPDEDFAWSKSEALKWIVSQPEILDYIWQSIRNRTDVNEFIAYNNDTGTWQGVDYDGD